MELVRQALMVLLVLGLLAGALWWLRSRGLAQTAWKRRGGKAGRSLQLIERLSLTPQHSVHLVRMAGRVILVGTSPSGCGLLDSADWKEVQSAISGATLQETTGAPQ
jgi:flagellar biogenesis protein FliO